MGSHPITPSSGGGGDLVKISSVTASASTSIDFTGLSSEYSKYVIMVQDVLISDGASDLIFRTSTDNGSTFDTTSYQYTRHLLQTNNAHTFDGSGSANAVTIVASMSDTEAATSGILEILKPTNESITIVLGEFLGIRDSGSYLSTLISGNRTVEEAVNAVQLLMTAGTITSGVFTLYGLKA